VIFVALHCSNKAGDLQRLDMKSWIKKRAATSLVAIVLTVLASGDDFNVAGLAWSYSLGQVPSGPSPVDDDNLDFVKSAESQEVLSKAPVACTTEGPPLILPCLLSPIDDVSSASHRLRFHVFSIPLRC